MAKKSFKDSPALAIIGHGQKEAAAAESEGESAAPKHYRLNLKLKAEHKEYLKEVSWRERTSITEYLNGLIEADKTSRRM